MVLASFTLTCLSILSLGFFICKRKITGSLEDVCTEAEGTNDLLVRRILCVWENDFVHSLETVSFYIAWLAWDSQLFLP